MMDPQWRITLADAIIGDAERKAVDDVLRSGWLSMGPRTELFEQRLGEFLSARHTLAVSSGTAALHLAASAIGIGPGDEVIVPALTFVASAAAMRQAGASVVLGDSRSIDDFALDPEEIERLAGARTRAVVVVHYGGRPADLSAIRAACERRDLLLIEDAAHALGATLDGQACGTIGDAGCFSFFPNKNITTGEGGALVVRDDAAAARARSLRSHAMTTLTWDRHRGHATGYDVVELGFNYRIDEIRAALGLAQLERLAQINAARGELVERYRERLAGVSHVFVPTQGNRGTSAHHLATLVADSRELRDLIRERLRAERIQTSVHYSSISTFSAYTDAPAHVPRAEEIADRSLTLPLHSNLTRDDVDLVCEIVAAVAA